MQMSKRELLLRKIKENNGIITTKEVLNLGINKNILKEFIIKDKNRIDAQVFSEAIKSYFAGKEKNLLKLSNYAVKMKMEQSLNLYTEVLL